MSSFSRIYGLDQTYRLKGLIEQIDLLNKLLIIQVDLLDLNNKWMD